MNELISDQILNIKITSKKKTINYLLKYRELLVDVKA
jgi:hypothetical protein